MGKYASDLHEYLENGEPPRDGLHQRGVMKRAIELAKRRAAVITTPGDPWRKVSCVDGWWTVPCSWEDFGILADAIMKLHAEVAEQRTMDFVNEALCALAAVANRCRWCKRFLEPDEQCLDCCPSCGGPADNGFDRSWPHPSPYYCTKCMEHW